MEVVVRRGAIPTDDVWAALSTHDGDHKTLHMDDRPVPALDTDKLYSTLILLRVPDAALESSFWKPVREF